MDLVTGGAGFIGSHLVDELVRRGRRVRVLDNFSSGRLENLGACGEGVEVVEGDILDLAAVRGAMRDVERVFHQAALGSVPRSIDDPAGTNRANVEGTLNVLRAARDAGVQRLVYASSSSVYGDGGAPVQREDLPTSPISPYAVSKLAAEQYCRVFTKVYGLPAVALRYFNVFGPRQDPSSQYAAVVAKFVQSAVDGESLEVHGDGLQSRDFTYVKNVVLANCLAAESDAAVGEAFNIACGARHSVLDIAQTLADFLEPRGIPVRWHHATARAGDVRDSLASIDKARSRLGYTATVPFAEGLRHTVEAALSLAVARR
ncbi:MAG: NAD-dependent epimerase/dehydratase family protein [Candidatus Rokubacteria bacterium]|nr:NAD-dependent epimerase/dehydratase family protein [Candidatus Rokubacteria bacterium]